MVTGRVCCRCLEFTAGPMILVAVPFSDSGPGGPAWYACVPCACVYAASPLAPAWIGEQVDKATGDAPP